jgi:thioredoxin-related protein
MKIIQKVGLLLIAVVATTQLHAQTNLTEALTKAKQENKHVFINFSGSDWCKSCIILKNTILNTADFKEFANKNLVVLNVDFPRSKKNQLSELQIKANEELAEKYNSKGQFPTIVLLNGEGKIVGKTGYKKLSPSQYIDHINSFLH